MYRSKIILGLIALIATGVMANTVAEFKLAELLSKSQQKLFRGKGSITSKELMAHLQKFQAIADANRGNRAAGTAGHEESAQYIAHKLVKAGYDVNLLPFPFTKFEKIKPGVLMQTQPEEVLYEDEKDFNVMSFSPSGAVTANVTAVDIALGEGNTSTSGCEEEDFEGFSKGDIALIQRGSCAFLQKAKNAQYAGAAGVVLFNQGNEATRRDLFSGTLSADVELNIPVLSVSYGFAEKLLTIDNLILEIAVSTVVSNDVSFNMIAETKSGNPDNVVMIGSHLDGVEAGPGINDNGSGSAAILEVALRMKDIQTSNKLRFAWWSAEELGLVGSTRYVEGLSEVEKQKIALYLNFDMVASKNYMLGVFDGDGSKFRSPGPNGSAAIEKIFQMYFTQNGTPSVEIEVSGRSDYAAFAAVGIPFGGIFTGAEGTKSEEEAKLYGGTAGEAYDACYHQECDTIDNINTQALEINANAIGAVALSFGESTQEIEDEKKSVTKGRFVSYFNNTKKPEHLGCSHELIY